MTFLRISVHRHRLTKVQDGPGQCQQVRSFEGQPLGPCAPASVDIFVFPVGWFLLQAPFLLGVSEVRVCPGDGRPQAGLGSGGMDLPLRMRRWDSILQEV